MYFNEWDSSPVCSYSIFCILIFSVIHSVDFKIKCTIGSAHAPVNGGPVFPGTILGYFGLIKHFLAEFLLFSIILYITLAL